MKCAVVVFVLGFAFFPAGAVLAADLSDKPEPYDSDYSYDPDSRPDPFVPFKATGVNPDPDAFTVESAVLVGITHGPDGYTALMKGPDGKTRFLRKGDRLEDGEILTVDAHQVVFKQTLPAGELPRDREVIKDLHPEASTNKN